MCLIAYQKPGTAPLKKEWLANGWDRNKDGAGYMFVAEGKLVIRKAFYKLKELKTAYAADHKLHGAASPFVVHFRWATHGDKLVENVHPHALANGRAALVHNGILDQFDPCHKTDISDTVLFCRTVLAMREPEQLTGEPFNQFLTELIGTHNKLVLMDESGNVSIVNSDRGVWVDTDSYWFSNTGYETTRQGVSLWSGITSAVSGVARGMVFGDKDKLPAKYRPAAPSPTEGLFDDVDDHDRWRDTEWEARAEQIQADELDELWALQYEVDHKPSILSNDDWDRYQQLCDAYPYEVDDHYDQRAEIDDDAWLHEKEMSLAMERDGR